ncbi:MAG: 50S ribosomal protein L29 [Deltaproteobacteria bacterium]
MKSGEIRELKDDELAKKLGEARSELFNFGILIATNQTTNVARVRRLKKDVARMLGITRQRQLAKGKERG